MEKSGSYPPRIPSTSVLIDSQFLDLISRSLVIITVARCRIDLGVTVSVLGGNYEIPYIKMKDV